MDDSIDDEAMVFYVLLKTNISVYTREVILTQAERILTTVYFLLLLTDLSQTDLILWSDNHQWTFCVY